MTLVEKKSKRKATAILNLVKSGEYSPSYALIIAEELNDNGKLLDVDYEEVAEFIEDLLNQEVEETQEETSTVEEIQEENEENYDDVVPYEMVN